jgi:hypothetical protein
LLGAAELLGKPAGVPAELWEAVLRGEVLPKFTGKLTGVLAEPRTSCLLVPHAAVTRRKEALSLCNVHLTSSADKA